MIASSTFDPAPKVVPALGLRLAVFTADATMAPGQKLSLVDDVDGVRVAEDDEIDLRPRSAMDLLLEIVRRSEQVVHRHPKSLPALRALGTSLLEAGLLEDAEDVFRRAAEIHDSSPTVQMDLARVLTARGRSEEAGAIYRRLAHRFTDAPGPLLGLADVASREKRFEDAVPLVKRALALADDVDGQLHYLLGVTLVLTTQERNYASAIHHLRAATRAKPRLAAYWYALGLAYSLNGNDEKAISIYNAAWQQRPSLTEAAHAIAAAHRRSGRSGEAARVLGKAIQLDPTDFRSRELLASIYADEGRHKLVRSELFAAMLVLQEHGQEQGQALARIVNNLGVSYRELRAFGEAERMFRRAIDSYANDARIPLQNLARLLIERNRSTEAIVLLEPLIETEQATDETVLVLAHAYFANGRVDSSIEVLRDAATRTPEPSVELLANLTSLLLDHRHGYEESAGILERGLRIHGPHFRLVNNLAYSYLMLDRVDEASSVIRRLPHPDERIESVELTATWGLLAFKLGDQGEGGRLYTLAQTEATRRGKVELAMQVRQKFALEMARFLLRRGDADSSRTFIEEGLRLKGREAFRSDLAELEREVEGLLPDRPKE